MKQSSECGGIFQNFPTVVGTHDLMKKSYQKVHEKQRISAEIKHLSESEGTFKKFPTEVSIHESKNQN